MRKEVYDYISRQPDLLEFLRNEPEWYRKLSRHPEQIGKFQQAARSYHGKTWPARIDRLANHIQMAQMMVYMFQSLRQK